MSHRSLQPSPELPPRKVTPPARQSFRKPQWLVKCIAAIESVQVELHGKYSVERVMALYAYQHRSSFWRCLGIVLLTPVPCLTIIILSDVVPLSSPDEGLSNNLVFWARVLLVVVCISLTVLEQERRFVPGLPFSTTFLWTMSIMISVGATSFGYMLSYFIGFPLPFTMLCGSPCWCFLYVVIVYFKWGGLLRASPSLRQDLFDYIKVVVVTISLTVVYPAFNFAFIQVDGLAQTGLAVLLPVLKLVAKNAISYAFNPSLEDFKPEVVIFNVEIFHALFVSCCMQNSTSITTSVVLIGIDLVHSWASIHDIDSQLQVIDAMEVKLRAADTSAAAKSKSRSSSSQRELSVIEKALYYANYDEGVKSNANIRLRTASMSPSVAVHPADSHPLPQPQPQSTKVVSFKHREELDEIPEDSTPQPQPPTTNPTNAATVLRSTHEKYEVLTPEVIFCGLSDEKKSSLGVLSTMERVQYVSNILQVLHIAEFILLIEFVEVMVPVVYCVYLTAMFYLPNRIFYPQLAAMDSHSLLSTIQNVMVYAGLEFVSFIGLALALRRKLQISPVHQLAFVLHRQWGLVQSKMILWVLFAVQITLTHFGYDYTFQFAWLRKQTP